MTAVFSTITGLDIGTSQVTAIIAELDSDGSCKIVGVGQSPSPGLRRGVIVHLDRTAEAIRRALADAELMEPLFKDAEKLRKDLFECVHASAQNAANLPQAGRLSGDAVERLREPMKVLLWSFAWPVLESFTKALKHIAKLRREDPDSVEIIGMDDYEINMEDAQEQIEKGPIASKEKGEPKNGEKRESDGRASSGTEEKGN